MGQHFGGNDDEQVLPAHYFPGRFSQLPGQLGEIKGQLQHVAGAQGQGQQLLGRALQICRQRRRRHQMAAFLAEEMGQSFDAEVLGGIEEIFGPQHQAGAFPGGGVLKQDLAPAGPQPGPGPDGHSGRRLPGPGPGGASPAVPGGDSGSGGVPGRRFRQWRKNGPISSEPGPDRN